VTTSARKVIKLVVWTAWQRRMRKDVRMSPASSTPAVSVILATRDRPELLRQAVSSVLAQDFDGSIEIIAVYDQTAPDASLATDLETSHGADRSIRVIENSRTPGLPGARNSGMAVAQGSWIAFCDDDDSWRPSKLSRQLGLMERMGLRASVTGICVHYGDELRERHVGHDRLNTADLVRSRVTAAHPSGYLAQRAMLLDGDVFVDEAIPGGYGEDYDWLLRVSELSDIAVAPEPLVDVLWHPGSFFTRRWETIIDALEYLLDKHPVLRADRRGHARILGQQAFALAATGRRRESLRKVGKTLWSSPRERRAYATLPVLCHIVSAERILHLANRVGRGI